MRERVFTKTYGIKSRIEPTPRQIKFIQRNFGCARKVYNLLVEEGNNRDAQAKAWHEENPEERANQEYPYKWRSVASYNEEYPYLQEADTRATKNARKHYHEARNKHFTEGAGRPTFKSKWDYPRTYTTDNQNDTEPGKGTIHITHHHGKDWLHVPKLPKNHIHEISERTGNKLKKTHCEDDDIRIILSRPITDTMRINTVTIGQEADGSYYASLNITETITTIDDIEAQETVDYQLLASLCFGGDLGLKSYLVGSDGVSYDDPADYRILEEKHRREQRKLGKQRVRLEKQGRRLSKCRNYQKQKRRVAKIARRIARKREDFRHKLSRQLVDGYDFIALEDLHVVGLLRNHHLARAVSESAWADFIKKVRYKASWAGKTVVLVSQWFPSTRTCSCCGAKTGPHGAGDLGVRFWVCSECGAYHDRDGNASWNILLEGLRVAASGECESASMWGRVYELVLARHRMGFVEPDGRVAPALTDGTSGVAWGKDEGVGSLALLSYPGMYTESTVDPFEGHRVGLGEPGVSKNSAENRLALRDEPMRICDLADWQGVSHPTMTSRMKHLANLRYVTRSEGSDDRRVVICGISETGQESLISIVEGVHARIPREWPLARASTRMLARVIRSMGTVPCDAGDLILLAMTVQEYETVCLTDLAKGTGLMQPTVSMAIQTLCNRGLVTMGKATEGDLRKKQISMTDAGRERATALIRNIESIVIRRRGAIEPDESA